MAVLGEGKANSTISLDSMDEFHTKFEEISDEAKREGVKQRERRYEFWMTVDRGTIY